MRQSACLVVNPITSYSYRLLFNGVVYDDGSGLRLNDDADVRFEPLVGA